VRIDGANYRWMSSHPQDVPAMQQTSLAVAPTHTAYIFEAAGVRLGVTFFTPAFTHDLDLLSRPVTYLSWEVRRQIASPIKYRFIWTSIAHCRQLRRRGRVWSRSKAPGLHVLNIGSRDQRVLNRAGDDLRIDWGYFHLAVPETEQHRWRLGKSGAHFPRKRRVAGRR